MIACIYVLLDENKCIRYVGCTASPLHHRLARHIRGCEGRNCKDLWIMDMLCKGLKPTIRFVASITENDNSDELERYWIQHFKDSGCELTNETNGGKSGYHYSTEARARIGSAHKGKQTTKGMHHSTEARAKMSVSQKGKPKSIEQRAKISNTLKGYHHSAETRAKMCESQRRRRSKSVPI